MHKATLYTQRKALIGREQRCNSYHKFLFLIFEVFSGWPASASIISSGTAII